MNSLLRRSVRLVGAVTSPLYTLRDNFFANSAIALSHSRWMNSAPFLGAQHEFPTQSSGYRSRKKPQRMSGIAVALGTAASSAAACTALLSIRRGPSLAEFSSSSATVAASVYETDRKAYTGPKVDITLYQYEVCPFCNKVRAYLDYHNIPYKVVEVDPLRKTEMKQFSSDYRKVPIAIVNGKQINGSANIIDHVNTQVKGEAAQLADSERKWVEWVDSHFIHLISPNIYRTVGESLQTFEYIADNAKFSPWQRATIRYSGAAVMYMVGKKLKKKYEIGDERAAMNDAVRIGLRLWRKRVGSFWLEMTALVLLT